MNRTWIFRPWFPYEIGMDKMSKYCSISNYMELFTAGFQVGEFRPALPVANLKLTLKDFNVDCFMWESRTFVSERMREVMSLATDAIQFFEVDASGSAAVPKAMNYKIMVIPVSEDVSDPANSYYRDAELPGGVKTLSDVRKIAVRPEFAPRYELFHDRFFLEAFCTDEFAVRLLRAKCTGVRFFDPSQLSIAGPMHFRTLKGLEEEGEWDPRRKIAHTKLIEAIH